MDLYVVLLLVGMLGKQIYMDFQINGSYMVLMSFLYLIQKEESLKNNRIDGIYIKGM